ncbi:IclR family transcriptional regulator [Caulobacter sp. RHG1]|uniref:IclR family transcriptional regulator n=1 Tax=Caulobacter sp. (strain RHG1) TaxID=2545762 RepID=UPI00155291B1|nr:IclR family transcriptional regulator [Caulobacter sp. RHG1]NQE61666.1 Transcriptional regulator, IclR family [Caulobacter sp. RHG1]
MNTKARPRPALSGVASADRVLSILTAFQIGDDTLELTELAERTGLVKSTIMRMAISLEAAGLVVRTLDGRYRLGGEIMRLATAYQEAMDLEQHIRPLLQHLAVETGETASFWIRQGDKRMCLYRENSLQALRLEVPQGTVRDLDKSSAANVLMDFGATPPTKTSPTALPYYSSGAHTPLVTSISVPVFSGGASLAGALTLSGPSARLTRDRVKVVSPVLIEVAINLSRTLGGQTAPLYDNVPTAA